METTEESAITFAQLAGAYLTHLLSDEAFQILLSLAEADLPPSWKSSFRERS